MASTHKHGKARKVATAPILASLLILGACNGGMRPTLISEDSAPLDTEPQVEVELNLPQAPEGTPPLPPAASDARLEASVDDALRAWAIDRSIPYVDSCSLVAPSPGQLCDSPTAAETVRLLGPSATEIWYVVTVEKLTTIATGTGYRVSAVTIAGR